MDTTQRSTTTPTDNLALFWAKWHVSKEGHPSYHPVICHLIDVAMVMDRLWTDRLPLAWKQRIAADLHLSLPDAQRWVVFFAGLHDLGKVCPGFQAQLESRFPASHHLVSQRLTAAKFLHQGAPWIAHGMISAKAMATLLPQQYGMERKVARTIATAVGGHHGVFFTPTEEQRHFDTRYDGGPWDKARLDMLQQLADLVEIAGIEVPHALSSAAAITIAGAITVADWLGSMSTTFTFQAPDATVVPVLDLVRYRDLARQRAEQVLLSVQWLRWTAPASTLTFADLFPYITHPRPLQVEAIALATTLQGPGIIVIESPTGEGKTEASLALADAWNGGQGVGGIYMAMPTQATGNSMYPRLEDYLTQRFPQEIVPLHLLHGKAELTPAFQEAVKRGYSTLPDQVDPQQGETTKGIAGAVIAAEWFVGTKRGLLAPFGVGTVDQSLIAALPVKHGFVRLFALSTKVVIVDEVHAYDTYMGSLMERLVHWLGALGTPIILLSATLPAARRNALLAAYATGAQWHLPDMTAQAPYPRMTALINATYQSHHVAADRTRVKPIHIRWITDTPADLVGYLQNILVHGGCIAIICSTVRRAQERYQAIRAAFPDEAGTDNPTVDLFHAQFPQEERQLREERMLRRFGKGGEDRPYRAILIATQVIEQSLDLDFDSMITDIAPIDLLVQRAGRVHRHERVRPAPLLDEPVLAIMGTDLTGVVPQIDSGTQSVYFLHLLLRTWLQLRQQPETITLLDVQEALVEWVYGDQPCPEHADPSVQALWEATLASMMVEMNDDTQEADNAYIGTPLAPRSPHDSGPVDQALTTIYQKTLEEDAPEQHKRLQARTRLGDPSVEVICLSGTAAAPRIGPHGPALPLHHTPDIASIRALQGRSLRIGSRRLVPALLATPVPAAWQKVGVLCRCRPISFDATGTATIGTTVVHLDPELGLIIPAPQGGQDLYGNI